jgi:hypothetical protein
MRSQASRSSTVSKARQKKAKKGKKKIRAGSAEEEKHLRDQLEKVSWFFCPPTDPDRLRHRSQIFARRELLEDVKALMEALATFCEIERCKVGIAFFA